MSLKSYIPADLFNESSGVDKFLARRANLLAQPIGHATKSLLKTKEHVRSRHK